MILGMTLATFTLVHVIISLIGIGSGLVVLFGMLQGKLLRGWNAVFLWGTVLTSVSGFGFPFALDHLLPSHKVGILSLVLLAIAIPALSVFRLAGGWRRVFAIGAIASLYLNVFVLIVQLFLKVPGLKALAPNGNEPPFAITQGLVLVVFLVLGVVAVKRFRGDELVAAH